MYTKVGVLFIKQIHNFLIYTNQQFRRFIGDSHKHLDNPALRLVKDVTLEKSTTDIVRIIIRPVNGIHKVELQVEIVEVLHIGIGLAHKWLEV